MALTLRKDDMRKHRARAKREVQKLVRREFPRQISTMSELLGNPISIQDAWKYGATAERRIERWVDTSFNTFTGWDALSTEDKRGRLLVFFEKAFRLYERVPKSEHALTWQRKQIESSLTIKGSSTFATSYNQYSRATGWLIRQLFKTGRIDSARDFFVSFGKSEEAFSLAQIYLQQGLPGYDVIDKLQGKSLQARDLRKLVGLYFIYSGIYEKMARLLVLFDRIRKGEIADYGSVRRAPLAQIEAEIEREPRLRALPRGFNRYMRNAIVHPSYTIRLSARTVAFRGSGASMEITWNQLRDETAKLSILVFAISITPFLHFFRNVILSIEKALVSRGK